MASRKLQGLRSCKPVGRAMDITMIATTVGGAAAANMFFPGLGSAVIGAVFGAIIGFRATKSA